MELLSPAGNLEKLKLACLYGADAVYIGGGHYSLRAAADNFSISDISDAVVWAHSRQKKVYVTVNAYLMDADLDGLAEYLLTLDEHRVDAIIASDLGVIERILNTTSIPVHLSTQTSVLNASGAQFWKSLGIRRIVLGREVSIDEAMHIRRDVGVEVEVFAHGAMCMAYSGHCMLSSYFRGRDANRGGCAHNCRMAYADKGHERFFPLSSTDLCALELIPKLKVSGVDSIKIEGRMKTELYVAAVTKLYREAIDHPERIPVLQGELEKIPHRTYAQGSLLSKAGPETFFDEASFRREDGRRFVGIVLETSDDAVFIHVKSKVRRGMKLEFLVFQGNPIAVTLDHFWDLSGVELEEVNPNHVIRVCRPDGVEAPMVVRMA